MSSIKDQATLTSLREIVYYWNITFGIAGGLISHL